MSENYNSLIIKVVEKSQLSRQIRNYVIIRLITEMWI
nr:MAG TPA: hypothetical protein [Caudoviricetes sp.]